MKSNTRITVTLKKKKLLYSYTFTAGFLNAPIEGLEHLQGQTMDPGF